MTNDELITTGQVADRAGVHRTTVFYWINTGKLPVASEVNGIRLIRSSDADALIAERTGDKLLTVQQAGLRLRPLGYHVGDLIRREQIGYTQQGRRKMIPESEVARIEAGHRDGAA